MQHLRDESFIKARDFRTHQAGHYVVGTFIGLPMAGPEAYMCCVPRDHIPLRSYALFEARSILRAVFDA